MTREEKIQAILQTVKDKKASGNEIEPGRKGATVSALKNPGKTSKIENETIDRLYESLQRILKEKGKSKPQVSTDKNIAAKTAKTKKTAKTAETKEPENTESMKKIAALEKENKALQEIVKELSSKVDNLSQKIDSITKSITLQKEPQQESITLQNKNANVIDSVIDKKESLSCLGFSLSKDKDGRYYGVKRVTGKLISVYIGRDLNLAQPKIRAYAEKHHWTLQNH